ncbi:hypothetical protein [Haloferax profundi]|uniref:Uncharacterized protein n=1 Tax=Haloferax profundi TaxID=1544718 RepID=A0A0W1SW23_9EURY|nr:hypothetical protein [Haloferax profundi]KTG30668.1 hypothetical protein AUR66_06745 [Haloferax profundi]
MTGGPPRQPQAILASHLARLDSQSCLAFVAEVWSARGFETDTDGTVVSATKGGRTQTILPVRGRWWHVGRSLRGISERLVGDRRVDGPNGRPSIDVVVSLGSDRRGDALSSAHGARHVDSAAFVEMFLYGLDRVDANRLAAQYLGAPIDGLRPPLRTRMRRKVARGGRRVAHAGRPTPRGVAALVVLVLVVSGGAVNVGLVASPVEWGTQSSAGVAPDSSSTASGQPTVEPYEQPVQSTSTPTPTPGATTSITDPRAATAPFDGEPTRADLEPLDDGDLNSVPGVTPTGIANLTELGDAHDAALSNRSYALWLDTYQPRDIGPNSSRIQYDTDVTVSENAYLIVENVEAGRNQARLRTVYYDGSDWYVTELEDGREVTRRVAGNATSPPVQFEPRELNRGLVRQYLATRTTNVTGKIREGNTTYYRIEGETRPSIGGVEPVQDYRFVAYVDDDGFVSAAKVTYALVSDAGVYRVQFEWTYGNLDSTTVSRPSWVTVNETDGDTTENGDDKPPSLRV